MLSSVTNCLRDSLKQTKEAEIHLGRYTKTKNKKWN